MPLLACPWRGARASSVGSPACLPMPATSQVAEQNGEPNWEPQMPPWMGPSRGGVTTPCKRAPWEGAVGRAVGAAEVSRDPLQHAEAVHPSGCRLGGRSRRDSSRLVGSWSRKSCRKAFLQVFVQTGCLSTAVGLGKRQNQRDAAARAGQMHPLCVAGPCYGALWCLEASQGPLICLRKGEIGSRERSARHQTVSTLINVFLLLLFQGAKGLSASETNGKRRRWWASPRRKAQLGRRSKGQSANGL